MYKIKLLTWKVARGQRSERRSELRIGNGNLETFSEKLPPFLTYTHLLLGRPFSDLFFGLRSCVTTNLKNHIHCFNQFPNLPLF